MTSITSAPPVCQQPATATPPPIETRRGLPHPDILDLIDIGLSLIPIQHGGKRPPEGFKWRQYQHKAATREQVQQWQEKFPGCNWGAVWGSVSGNVIAVDIDSPDAFAWCQKQGGFNQCWPVWYTTGRGYQYLFRLPAELADKGVIIPHESVELRTSGHISVIPPSIHKTGKAYQWKRYGRIPFAPRWILNILTGVATQDSATRVTSEQRPAQSITRYAQRTHRRREHDIAGRNPKLLESAGYRSLWRRTFPEGSRNSAFFSTAILLRGAGLSEDEARHKLNKWRREHTYPIYPAREAAAVIKCAFRIGYGVTVEGLRKAIDVNGKQMPEGVALDLVRAFPSLRAHGKRQNVPMMETVARVLIALYKSHVMKPTALTHAELAKLTGAKESQISRITGFLNRIGVRTTKRRGRSTVSTYNLKTLTASPNKLIPMFARWRGYYEVPGTVVWRWWRRLHALLAQMVRYLVDVFDSLSTTLQGELAEPSGRLAYACSTTRGPPK